MRRWRAARSLPLLIGDELTAPHLTAPHATPARHTGSQGSATVGASGRSYEHCGRGMLAGGPRLGTRPQWAVWGACGSAGFRAGG